VKVAAPGEAKLTVNRSRFYAVVFPADSMEEVEQAVRRLRGRHRKARHLCWACRLAEADGGVLEQSRDDGEVGHPGRVLLEILRREDLQGGMAVARIYGGVKLGVGGVSRAFRDAAQAALEQSAD
jgi:putative IMPACT (imprinted ancient) family translation regulator